MGHKLWRGLQVTILIVIVVVLWILWRRHPGVITKVQSTDSSNQSSQQARPEEKTIYVDGTKVVQVSAGNTVTNLTTVQNLQQITHVVGGVDTLGALTCSANQTALFSGSLWACSDQIIDTDTDEQDISLIANQLAISNGNSIDLSTYLDNTDLLASQQHNNQ